MDQPVTAFGKGAVADQAHGRDSSRSQGHRDGELSKMW